MRLVAISIKVSSINLVYVHFVLPKVVCKIYYPSTVGVKPLSLLTLLYYIIL